MQVPFDDSDPETRPRKTMPLTLGLASLAMLAGGFDSGPLAPRYSPPRIPQTDESKAAALQAAEEKRARRRAKRAKG